MEFTEMALEDQQRLAETIQAIQAAPGSETS
jgi:hypothetical protein